MYFITAVSSKNNFFSLLSSPFFLFPPKYKTTKHQQTNKQGDDYLDVFENFTEFYTFDQEFTEDEKRILAVQWCNGQVGMGESSQSSSPLDPTFWSMHPTMERLLV